MNAKRFLLLAVLAAVAARPASAGTKEELIKLQTQVQAIQDQMARMQQSLDERMGIMRNMIEQSTDNVNRMTAAVDALQKNLQAQNQDSAAKVDQVSTQVQALHDSLDELKTRFARLAQQLEQQQSAQTNLAAGASPPGQAPPPDILYNNALRDYNAGKYELAQQEFADYLKFYAGTDLAGNAQFYLGEIAYRQGNFQGAVGEYDKVLDQYPGGNKAAAAQLKKGYALVELGQKEAGVTELQALVSRFPRSVEATQARDKLRQLGVTKRPARRTTQ